MNSRTLLGKRLSEIRSKSNTPSRGKSFWRLYLHKRRTWFTDGNGSYDVFKNCATLTRPSATVVFVPSRPGESNKVTTASSSIMGSLACISEVPDSKISLTTILPFPATNRINCAASAVGKLSEGPQAYRGFSHSSRPYYSVAK